MVGLDLDRGEALGAFRQVRHAAVAGGGIGQRDHAAGVQESVRRHQRRHDRHVHADFAAIDRGDDDPEQARQAADADRVEFFEGGHDALL